MTDMKMVGLVDPVSNEMLAPGWKHPDHLPPLTDKDFFCLVLVGVHRPDSWTPPIQQRVLTARLNTRVSLIGSHFAFDQPPIVAWHDLPPLFLEQK